MRRPMMSSRETAALMGVSDHYLAQMRYRRDGPPYVRLSGKTVVYDPDTVEAWLASRTVMPQEEAF